MITYRWAKLMCERQHPAMLLKPCSFQCSFFDGCQHLDPVDIGAHPILTSGTPFGGIDLFEISVPLTPSITSRLKPVSEAES